MTAPGSPSATADEFAYSVVIPTKDRPQEVDRALRLLSEQTVKPVEIVVVDASSPPLELDAETCKQLAGKGISVRVLKVAPSTARQRNAGVDAVGTPLVLLLDDDIILPADYVARLIERWRERGPTAVSGMTGYSLDERQSLRFNSPLMRALRLLFMLHIAGRRNRETVVRRSGKLSYGVETERDVVVPAAGAGAVLFRTALVRRHRYSERFEGYVLGEDLDLAIRVSQEAPLVRTPEHFEHLHSPGGKHSPLRWFYRGRPETYFRLRNRHLTGLTYPAFWLSVFAESMIALAESARERDHRHVVNYLRGVTDSVREVRREYFTLHSPFYYRAKSLYESGRLFRSHVPSDGPLSNGLRILGYHRVAEGDMLGVPPDTLRRQLEIALDRGAAPVSLSEGLELIADSKPLDRPYLAVTFDDGYLDNLEAGLPVLEDLGIPATIFLVSAIADGRDGFHWYRENPPAAIRWEDARRVGEHPLLDFQAHGTYHRRLTALGEGDVRDEIIGAKAAIEHELGTRVTIFCYASGLYGDREVRLLRESGYRAAVTTTPGVNQSGSDLYGLERLMVSAYDGERRFAQKLTGVVTGSRLERWVLGRRRFEPLLTGRDEAADRYVG
jgi:peptidoglycan/xylan/chitin deacetylase (PgdA/CDA1 family)/glycosyltransferase involved in cell wall biosynthesis